MRQQFSNPLTFSAWVGVVVCSVVWGLALACATYDGAGFDRVAQVQISSDLASGADLPIAVSECEALADGAAALRDESGDSKSLIAPLAAGQHVDRLAGSFERLALICFELSGRERLEPIAPELRTRNRVAWRLAWRNARALLGTE